MQQTERYLHEVFNTARRPVLWVSGGKDSLTLLALCRKWRHLCTVLHRHEPDGWPGVTENLTACLNAWGFLRSVYITAPLTVEAYTQRYGWPVEIVPSVCDVTTTFPPSPFRRDHSALVSWWHCTIMRQMLPMQQATATLGADVVLTGSRAEDAPVFEAAGATWHDTPSVVSWRRVDPLHHWTTAQVYDYIDAERIPLPLHYSLKRTRTDFEWVDCLSCTWQPEHWQVLREHYPDEYTKRWPQVAPVFESLRRETEALTVRMKELDYD